MWPFNLQTKLIVAGVGALLLVSATSCTTWKLSKKYYDSHYTTIIDEKDKEFSDYRNTVIANKQKADAAALQLKDQNQELITQLNAKVRHLESANYEQANEIRTISRNYARAVSDGRRVFIDKAKAPSTCTNNSHSTGTTGQTETKSADARELSRETTQFLLDYAESAELTRLDLQTQMQYADQVQEAYNQMRQNYQKLADYIQTIE